MSLDVMPREPVSPRGDAEPTFGDLVRFLWSRRVRLAMLFVVFAGISLIALLLWRFAIASPVAEGTLALSFRGMERHEYPSGKKFSIEDIRAPQVLAKARANAGLPQVDLTALYVGIEITPVIPTEVQARWRKQDRDGVRREEFFSTEYRVRVSPKGLSTDQKIQFLTALVRAYQDEVKFEQDSAVRRVADLTNLSPAELVKTYDTWDLPNLLREREAAFRTQIEILTKESHDFRDPRFNRSFRDVGNELSMWRQTRLEALTAFIYKGRVVKEKELMTKRLRQRLDDLDVESRQLSGEAEQSTKLLEMVERSKPLLAGALTNRDGAPLVDTNALDRLVRSDYVGPVVKRISDLNKQLKEVEAEKARVEQELAILAKAENVAASPAGLEGLVALVTKELSHIVESYNRLLDTYLNATVTTLVILKEGPLVAREGPRASTLAAVLLVISAVLPFLIVLFERAFRTG